MPSIAEVMVYSFDELNNRAKQTAREWFRSGINEDFDISNSEDDFEECAKRLGIEFDGRTVKLHGGGNRVKPTIYYSGFNSQGDGACFEGSYSYKKGATKLIAEYAPKDRELNRIALALQDVQRRNFYRLTASMSHSGHYYHSGCMAVSVEDSGNEWRNLGTDDETIRQLMKDFADWMYDRLEKEYEHIMSDEYVDDCIRINEYTFTENGDIF